MFVSLYHWNTARRMMLLEHRSGGRLDVGRFLDTTFFASASARHGTMPLQGFISLSPCRLALVVLLCLVAGQSWAEGRFGLVFVYQGSCPYSQALSPSLKAITDHYGFVVLPVTLDGQRFAEWPTTQMDQGQAERLGIRRVPFVALYDRDQDSLTLITDGAMRAPRLHAIIINEIREASYGRD